METQTVVRDNEYRFERFFAIRGSRWVIGAAALMVLLAGLWAARQSGEARDLEMRDNLLSRATDVAAAFNVFDIRNLSFTAADKEKARFQRMCVQMRDYTEVSEPGRLYVIGLRDGRIVSGPENSIEPALPPGTVYENPDQQNFDVFEKGHPQVWDSFKDKNRTHVTALVPIADPYTGEVLAAVGMDAEDAKWHAAVLLARVAPVWITLALLVVLLLSDLALEYLRRHSARRAGRVRHTESLLCAVFMLMLTLVMTVYFAQKERAERRRTFNSLAHADAGADAEKIYDLRGMLQELAYYFESEEEGITREEFSSYCNAMVGKNLVDSIVWIPAVPDKEVNSFTEGVRAAGVPDFSIWQKNKEGRNEPVALRPVYYPVLYIEPLSRHQGALGYDINSEPKRSTAIQEALSTGLASASDSLQFITATNDSPYGFFVFLPVQARAQKGLVAVTIRPTILMAASTRKKKNLTICLFQLKSGQEPLFLAGSSDSCGLPCWDDKEYGLHSTVPVFRFGKAYAFRVIPGPAWLAEHPLSNGRITCGVGLLLTLLVSSLAILITNRRTVLERLVERRTDELKLAQENLTYLNKQNELILTSAAEGILGLDLQGNHRFINPAALKMLGYEIEELIGRPSHSLWHHSKPDGTPYPLEECKIYATYRDGTAQHSADEVFWRKNGTCFPVEYDSTPIHENGQVTGAVVTFTDITNRKKSEEDIRKSLALLAATLDATTDGILVVDGKGKILRYNKKFIEMWRIPESIAESGDDNVLLDFVLEQLCESEQFLAKVQELYRNPEEKSFDVLRFHDGRVFERTSQPQKVHDGVLGRVWSFHDVTSREQAESALWSSQTKLDLALQAALMGVWQWDVVTNKRTYDRQTCAFLGIDPLTFGGTEAELLAAVHPDDRQKVKDALTQTLEQHTPYDVEYRALWPDGTIRHIAARAHLFLDDGDQQLKVTGVCWDITERKWAEEELQDAREILQAAMDHSPAGIAVADAPDGKLRYVNKAALLIRGGTHDDVVRGVGLDEYVAIWKLFNVDGTPLPLDEVPLTRAIKYGETGQREFIIRRADNDDRIVIANAAPIIDLHGKITAAIVIFLDITDRRRAEERIRLLAQHLETVREEERKRIARELHDDIGQILTAIKIDMVGVQADCHCEGSSKGKIAGIQQLLLDGIQSVHTLCRQLRPGALDDLDLSDALEGLIDDWKLRNRVECTICSDVDDGALSDEIKTAVFRMVQEALTNVSRYAQASKVEINLVADEQAINVTITDDGRGMAPGAADKPTSFGLLGMRERLEALGGELDIESFLGKGTRIEGTIPLSPKG
jgi:PAS domain S-box-containing protein